MSLKQFIKMNNLTSVIFAANIHLFKVLKFKIKFLNSRRNSGKLNLLVSFLKLVLVSSVSVGSSGKSDT